MRSRTPTLHCDADDCTAWSVDYYAATATTVDGVRITTTERAPGWACTRDEDLCPECVNELAAIARGGDQ